MLPHDFVWATNGSMCGIGFCSLNSQNYNSIVHICWLFVQQNVKKLAYRVYLHLEENIYSGDPEIGPPMGLTESGPILESV